MKKYIPILALTVFIIPSVAFASWWNPATWFNNWTFSNNSNTSTTALEQKITELENKVDSLTSTTTSTTSKQIIHSIFSSTTASTLQESNVESPDSSSLKPVQNNQDQTSAYKNLLIDRITSIFASAKYNEVFIDKITPSIDARINAINSTISKNESLENTITDSYMLSVIQAFNNVYTSDNNYSYSQEKGLANERQLDEQMMNDLDARAASTSQAQYISSTEFAEQNTALDNISSAVSSMTNDLKNDISDYINETESQDQTYQNDSALMEAKISSLSTNSNYSSSQVSQYNYIPPQIIVPTINPINTTSCTMDTFGNTATINCNSF